MSILEKQNRSGLIARSRVFVYSEKQADRMRGPPDPCCLSFRSGVQLLQLRQAAGADVPAFILDDILYIVAESAGGLILLQNDLIAVHVDLQGILLRDIQGAPQFNGQNDAAEAVHLSDDSGSLHLYLSSHKT